LSDRSLSRRSSNQHDHEFDSEGARHLPVSAAEAITGTMSFLAELWMFVKSRRKLWLYWVLFLMVVFSGLFAVTKGSVVAPLIYTLF
jgi:hypothetical protein